MSATFIPAYDNTGAPLPGLTPSWSTYRLASSGASAVGPTISEQLRSGVGTGVYETSPDAAYCGIVDLGVSAVPRYVFVAPATATVFPIWDGTGAPKTGITPTWTVAVDTATGLAPSPTPTFAEIGGGLYRVDGRNSTTIGIAGVGAGNLPSSGWFIGLDGSVGTLSVSNPQPTPSAGPILPGTAISIDVTGTAYLTPGASELAFLMLSMTGGGQPEVPFGPGGTPTSLYSDGSTIASITGGQRFIVKRANGWLGALTLNYAVSDTLGNNAAGTYAWNVTLPAPVVPSTSGTASSANTGASTSGAFPYGTDVETYLNGDLDPLFTIITDPRRVLAEVVLRRWETVHGAYPGDPNVGWWIYQLVNASLSSQQIRTAQTLLAQEAQADERIAAAVVTLTPIPATQSLLVQAQISPRPTTGTQPFVLTCSVSALTPQLLNLMSVA